MIHSKYGYSENKTKSSNRREVESSMSSSVIEESDEDDIERESSKRGKTFNIE